MSLEDLKKILDYDITEQKNGVVKSKVLDKLDNYIKYFKNADDWSNKLTSTKTKSGNKIYIKYLYDGEPFVIDAGDNVVINAKTSIENDLCLKKINDIKTALKFICNENATMSENESSGAGIAESYVSEYNEINDLLDDIINDETLDNDPWVVYKNWRDNSSIKNYNSNGEVTGISDCYNNIVDWLEHYPPLIGQIKYNDKSNRVDIWGDIYDDNTVHTIMGMLNKHFIRKYSNIKGLNEAIKGCANKHHYDPFKDYIESLTYDDSNDWIEYLLTDVIKAEMWDEYSELYKAELRMWLYAAIKRVYEPGCKFDNILVFVSKNGGTGKTSVIENLFDINGQSFSKIVDASQQITMNDRFFQQCASNVCINFDEVAMKSANVNKIKTMLTQQSDEWHTLYAVADAPTKRSFVFAGSTNNTDFLKDYTTMFERRWWIIKVTEDTTNGINVNKIFNDNELNLRDKIWAQVKHMYDNKSETNLYITQGSELGDKLEILQRGYKASNNEDYAEIVNIMQMNWGFFNEYKFVNVDSLVKQYKSGDAIKYCERRNYELNELRHKEGYIMKPDDLDYVCYGQIDRWPVTLLHDLIDKLGIRYTKQSLKNELEYANEFEYKYSRCIMNNGKPCLSWCRTEDTPTNKFFTQKEEEFFNESQGYNEHAF